MADLRSDIVGRVNRLALRPTEKNALLPLMEAISNSVHSVTERFGSDTHRSGQILVRISRSEESEEIANVVGFEVEDNGIGFTDENFVSFQTPDSRLKEKKGGKGVGRLAWLKVFEQIGVESCYREMGQLKYRYFDFVLAERDQIKERTSDFPQGLERTLVTFKGFKPDYVNHCPSKDGIIEERIAAHFMPLFLTGNAPKIIVFDRIKTDIQDLFSQSIVEESTETVVLKLGEEISLTVWSLKCKRSMRFNTQAYHFSFVAGDARSVLEYPMDDQLGLRWIDKDLIYVACTSRECPELC